MIWLWPDFSLCFYYYFSSFLCFTTFIAICVYYIFNDSYVSLSVSNLYCTYECVLINSTLCFIDVQWMNEWIASLRIKSDWAFCALSFHSWSFCCEYYTGSMGLAETAYIYFTCQKIFPARSWIAPFIVNGIFGIQNLIPLLTHKTELMNPRTHKTTKPIKN